MRASTHAEEIALADLDAVVAQDAVGGGGMEVEVREGETAERNCWPFSVMVLSGPAGKVTSLVSAPSNCAGLNDLT